MLCIEPPRRRAPLTAVLAEVGEDLQAKTWYGRCGRKRTRKTEARPRARLVWCGRFRRPTKPNASCESDVC